MLSLPRPFHQVNSRKQRNLPHSPFLTDYEQGGHKGQVFTERARGKINAGGCGKDDRVSHYRYTPPLAIVIVMVNITLW